jgi:hypothetical protein
VVVNDDKNVTLRGLAGVLVVSRGQLVDDGILLTGQLVYDVEQKPIGLPSAKGNREKGPAGSRA